MATTKRRRVRLRKSAASMLRHADETPFKKLVSCRDWIAFRHRDVAEVTP